jgi:hypothetical protein
MPAHLSVIAEFVAGQFDAEPSPVTTELVLHMDRDGQSEIAGVHPERPGDSLLHLEVGDVLVAFGKRYELANFREFPPAGRQNVAPGFASVRACLRASGHAVR